MKICLISNLYRPWIIGGAEIYVESIAKALSEKNEVFIITSKPFSGIRSLEPEIDYQDKIKIYRFFPVNVYHTFYAKKVANIIKPVWHLIDIWNPHSYLAIERILKMEKPDIVHTHNLGGISPSAFYAANKCKIPIVHTLHDCSFTCPRAILLHEKTLTPCNNPTIFCRLYSEIKKKTTNKIDAVISPSKFILDIFNNAGFFESSYRKLPVPLGFDISLTFNKKQKDTINLLYIGYVARHKGVDFLIKAFKELPMENLRLHIAGIGPDIDEMRKVAADDRIIFHGFVSGWQKDDLFSITDICIVPSIFYENSPVVIYESFFHGIPVLGSRIGGIPELIEDGYNGILFPAENTTELKNSIQYLIDFPDELKRLSRGALESAKKYTIQAHISKLEDIYASLLNAIKNETHADPAQV